MYPTIFRNLLLCLALALGVIGCSDDAPEVPIDAPAPDAPTPDSPADAGQPDAPAPMAEIRPCPVSPQRNTSPQEEPHIMASLQEFEIPNFLSNQPTNEYTLTVGNAPAAELALDEVQPITVMWVLHAGSDFGPSEETTGQLGLAVPIDGQMVIEAWDTQSQGIPRVYDFGRGGCHTVLAAGVRAYYRQPVAEKMKRVVPRATIHVVQGYHPVDPDGPPVFTTQERFTAGSPPPNSFDGPNTIPEGAAYMRIDADFRDGNNDQMPMQIEFKLRGDNAVTQTLDLGIVENATDSSRGWIEIPPRAGRYILRSMDFFTKHGNIYYPQWKPYF